MHRFRTEHMVPVSDFGLLLTTPQKAADWAAYVHQLVADRRADMPFLVEAGLNESEVTALMQIVETLARYHCQEPVLCHGDLSMDHVFVDDDLQLCGIIDFGPSQGGEGPDRAGVSPCFTTLGDDDVGLGSRSRDCLPERLHLDEDLDPRRMRRGDEGRRVRERVGDRRHPLLQRHTGQLRRVRERGDEADPEGTRGERPGDLPPHQGRAGGRLPHGADGHPAVSGGPRGAHGGVRRS